jgi:hypothetical protein
MKKRLLGGSVKGELARHIGRYMSRVGIGRDELARRSGASRVQVDRVLDPADQTVRLLTLAKVTRVVKPRLRLVLGRAQVR